MEESVNEMLKKPEYVFYFSVNEDDVWSAKAWVAFKKVCKDKGDLEEICHSFSSPMAGKLYLESLNKEIFMDHFKFFLDKVFKEKGWENENSL